MSRERRARRWLRLDAAYCAGAGVLALVLANPLSTLFRIPTGLVSAAGVATLVWAVSLALLARRRMWRPPLLFVGGANVLAAVAIGVSAYLVAATGARVLLAAVAFEVAAFAAMQFGLLRG